MESPYLSHGFACHRLGEILGPLSAFNVFLSIPGTILWGFPYLIHGSAFHHHGRMLALLSALQLLSLQF